MYVQEDYAQKCLELQISTTALLQVHGLKFSIFLSDSLASCSGFRYDYAGIPPTKVVPRSPSILVERSALLVCVTIDVVLYLSHGVETAPMGGNVSYRNHILTSLVPEPRPNAGHDNYTGFNVP